MTEVHDTARGGGIPRGPEKWQIRTFGVRGGKEPGESGVRAKIPIPATDPLLRRQIRNKRV